MATPTAPRRAQILAKVQALLSAIVAGTTSSKGWVFWLTPDRVLRVAGTTGDVLDTSLNTVYCISPDVTDKQRRDTGQVHDASIELDLDCFSQYNPDAASESPFLTQNELKEDLQDRMAADVEAKLMEDTTFGVYTDANGQSLEVWDVQVTRLDYSPEVTNIDGWARSLMRVSIKYRYRSGTP